MIQQLLYGYFNKALNWTCGIMASVTTPLLYFVGNKEGAKDILHLTLTAIGLKILLELTKWLKEMWPLFVWLYDIYKKRKDKE